jgi:hypothetical protein
MTDGKNGLGIAFATEKNPGNDFAIRVEIVEIKRGEAKRHHFNTDLI